MSLRSRIVALAQQAKGLAIPASSAICGGHMPGVDRYVVCDQDGNTIELHDGRKPIPQCPQCGLLVGEIGKALHSATAVPAGSEVQVKRIILHDVHGRRNGHALAPTG